MKREILDSLLKKMNDELESLEGAFEATKSLATDQEFRAESKYDTRALEASYLASAKQKRIEEIKLDIQILSEVDLDLTKNLGEITIGSLVELEHKNQIRSYFLIPTAGGEMIQYGQDVILVISVFSPIGSAMMGLGVSDSFDVEAPKETRNYKVIRFF